MAVSVALAADAALGEPAIDPHPVAAFGTVMERLEARCYADRRSRGLAHCLAGVGLGATAGAVIGSTGLTAYLAVAGRALSDEALAVAALLAGDDLDAARHRLPALVGRDTGGLDAGEISRAVIESVAENTVDAVVAPALWALVAGAPGALAYRAINTLDAMVGHRSDRYLRFGWASAKADDAAGWLPARLTALLVACVRPTAAARVWRAVRVQAPAHPSPNAGVAEAAFAAALGRRLGGTNVYGYRIEERPALGEGPPASVADISRAAALSRDVVAFLALLLTAPSLARAARCRHNGNARRGWADG